MSCMMNRYDLRLHCAYLISLVDLVGKQLTASCVRALSRVRSLIHQASPGRRHFQARARCRALLLSAISACTRACEGALIATSLQNTGTHAQDTDEGLVPLTPFAVSASFLLCYRAAFPRMETKARQKFRSAALCDYQCVYTSYRFLR